MNLRIKIYYVQLIIPTIALGIMFFSSLIFLNLNKSLTALRFIGDDFQQVIDKEAGKSGDYILYKTNTTLAIDISKGVQGLLNDETLQGLKMFSKTNSLNITFSAREIKNYFYKSIQQEKKLSPDLLELLQTKAKTQISAGEICYHNRCTKQFIALKKIKGKKLHN